ncbi:MAG TPA: PD-(D/E)XK nuclease family protein [Planctomycetota bacterium]|nr:PD-(D/E)XK nuclease family protein [Planctomycetota bacterium]
MATPVNEVSWSRTRMTTFEACRRRYWYQYYLKWNGWRRDAPPEREAAYRLSQMTNLPMLAGLAVHDALRRTLVATRDGETVAPDDAVAFARAYMNRVWKDAREMRWRAAAKTSPPVFELYYGDGPSAEAIARAGETARRATRNFAESDLFDALRRTDRTRWLWIDDRPDFDALKDVRIEGRRVWALPDFARDDDGTCVLYDWKTGAPKDDDALQVLSYALHARAVWGYPSDRIRALLVYLCDGVEVREVAVDAARLAEVEARIAGDLRRMIELHRDDPPCDGFPISEDRAVCGECFFQELCPAMLTVPTHRRSAQPAPSASIG